MSQLQVADNSAASDTEAAQSAYVPPLQRTTGQPPPIAAHGGLSYMAFDPARGTGRCHSASEGGTLSSLAS
jgi:hypothetical protein